MTIATQAQRGRRTRKVYLNMSLTGSHEDAAPQRQNLDISTDQPAILNVRVESPAPQNRRDRLCSRRHPGLGDAAC